MINQATLENLRRKSAFVDVVQLDPAGLPMPSWIDLNLTELCNRGAGTKRPCVFCPRIDPELYPNQPLHMSLATVHEIRRQLAQIEYTGAVVLCGFGEPMLHPTFLSVVHTIAGYGWRVELVTNGDKLTTELARDLYRLGLECIVVSMYDGPHQVLKFATMLSDAGGVEGGSFILRDRWHTEADAFGLKLTNRAGTVTVGDQEAADPTRPCHYLAYQMTVEWNGDVLLCPQDWHKRVRFGNLRDRPILEIWNSRPMKAKRAQLIRGDRSGSPCAGCNTDGCLHGFNHVEAWNARRA